jgi:hypothetical protein
LDHPVPLHLGVEQLADGVEIAAQRGLETAPGRLHVGLHHELIVSR